MSRSLDRTVRFTGPFGYIMNMMIFILVVGAIMWYFSPYSVNPNDLLIESFNSNPALNGLILFVLFIGVIFNLRRAGVVGPSVARLNGFRDSVDPTRTKLPRAPSLISAMTRMLLDADERGGRLSQSSTRAILDSLDQRMDEGRELTKYISNLLVFLGLLGTFWGLLGTVSAMAEVIISLGESGESDTGSALSQLITNLSAPLSGMGTAFSSSLFGLGGSLVVGYLDIQAGQAQSRFYSDVEDWLSGITQTVTTNTPGVSGAMSDDAATNMVTLLNNIDARLQQLNETEMAAKQENAHVIREEIRALGRTLIEGTPPPTDLR